MPVVDAWSQIPTPRFMQAPWLDTLLRWTGIDRNAPSVADTLAAMDAAGIDIALLSAWHGPQGSLIHTRGETFEIPAAGTVRAAVTHNRSSASVVVTRGGSSRLWLGR